MKQISFSLDFRSGIPITTQIVDQVQSRLSLGELVPGDQLPTVRQLASDLRVNFNTVARAYRILDEVGLISTQQGRGTYILNAVAPLENGTGKLKGLEMQIERFFAALKNQGFELEEITPCIDEAVRSWREGSLIDSIEKTKFESEEK